MIQKKINSQTQMSNAKNTNNKVDTVTITTDKELLVTEENKSAAKTAFKDIRQVEEAVERLKKCCQWILILLLRFISWVKKVSLIFHRTDALW